MSGDVDYEKGDAEKHLLLLCSVCAFCGDSFCRHALPRDAFCGDLQMMRARTGYDRIVLWPRRLGGDSFRRHALPRDAFCGDLQMLRARTGYDRIVLWPRRIIVRLLPLRWCILRRGRCLGTAA